MSGWRAGMGAGCGRRRRIGFLHRFFSRWWWQNGGVDGFGWRDFRGIDWQARRRPEQGDDGAVDGQAECRAPPRAWPLIVGLGAGAVQ